MRDDSEETTDGRPGASAANRRVFGITAVVSGAASLLLATYCCWLVGYSSSCGADPTHALHPWVAGVALLAFGFLFRLKLEHTLARRWTALAVCIGLLGAAFGSLFCIEIVHSPVEGLVAAVGAAPLGFVLGWEAFATLGPKFGWHVALWTALVPTIIVLLALEYTCRPTTRR